MCTSGSGFIQPGPYVAGDLGDLFGDLRILSQFLLQCGYEGEQQGCRWRCFKEVEGLGWFDGLQ